MWRTPPASATASENMPDSESCRYPLDVSPGHHEPPSPREPRRPTASSIAIAAVVVAITTACGPTVPNSPSLNAASGDSQTPSARWASRVLDDDERREVRSVLRASAGDLTAAEVGPGPETRPHGRWRDVPDAVAAAAGPLGIAVLERRPEPAGSDLETAVAIEFRLLTLENEPGRLRVERRDPPHVAEAFAEIGLFRQRRELASRFVEAIGEELRRWGRKPELEPIASPIASPSASPSSAPPPPRP